MSTPPGNPGSNGQRVAAVKRLKAAVAERKQLRDQKKAGKETAGSRGSVATRNRSAP